MRLITLTAALYPITLTVGAQAPNPLEAASVRDVAKEAGVSAGMVQHHFRTRDEMLRFACEYMVERTQNRISPLVAAIPEPRSARAILEVMFRELLPLDEERRNEIRIWMAFLARAVVQPEMEAFMRETHVATQATIVGLLRHAADWRGRSSEPTSSGRSSSRDGPASGSSHRSTIARLRSGMRPAIRSSSGAT